MERKKVNQQTNGSGVRLHLTLSPQDAELLRAAVSAENPSRDALGIKETSALAQMALGAVCRSILSNGYRPRPVATILHQEEPGKLASLSANTIEVQLA